MRRIRPKWIILGLAVINGVAVACCFGGPALWQPGSSAASRVLFAAGVWLSIPFAGLVLAAVSAELHERWLRGSPLLACVRCGYDRRGLRATRGHHRSLQT